MKTYLVCKYFHPHRSLLELSSTNLSIFENKRLIDFVRKSPQASFTCYSPTYLGPRYPGGLYGAVDSGEETAVRFFTEWQQQVKADIPADRLLVFEVKDGWEPLCQFLGLPVPQEPFPNVNDTAEVQQTIRRMKRACYLFWGIGIAAAGVAGYYLDLMDHIDIKKLLS